MNSDNLLTIYKNWAVVGVSDNKEKYGYKIYSRLKKRGYNVFGVNPRCQEVDGDSIYKDLDVVPSPIDVVVFVISPKYIKEYIGQMRTIGIGYAWMQPGTYNDEILDLMNSHGISYVLDCVLQKTEI